MIISKKAIDFIVAEEVSSAAAYEKKYTGIIWPGGASGATIGIGYDLGYATIGDVQRDWGKEISPYQVEILKMFCGVTSDAAKRAIQANMISRDVKIPYKSAYNVFVKTSLVKYGKKALAIYPGLDKLFPDAVGGIVSMVYNRGNSLQDSKQSIANKTYSRAEMRAIVPMVAQQDYCSIAVQIDRSKRLWQNGLVGRREREAALVKNSMRQYKNDELVEI